MDALNQKHIPVNDTVDAVVADFRDGRIDQ
ncbi:hypothetical protein AGR2A_Lc70113 [Agrobacterium genomosp. 2 str. CFBP 5494]|uniref:Uncharacterized protein n=1 Tax=Agrobacterium genomosp. 2 str. CFBP 5494 TaxID=1183436 RepID=A0A9W5F6K9_9HYPH|nr:hypothetical protein AGR2A_Lc70113 [Agrobacterium genomosp. 2 str. CFBP 5494]